MIGKHLRAHKKRFKERIKAEGLRRNSDWKHRWLPFIKYDQDFDGGYFLELIVYKLHILLDYYEHGKYCIQADESRLEIVKSLQEACKLGDMLVEDHFDYVAHEFSKQHTKGTIEKTTKGCWSFDIIWDNEVNKLKYDSLVKQAQQERENTKQKFFKYLADHYEEWWD
jgi:hypothetical protein